MKKTLILFLVCLFIVGCSSDEVEEDNKQQEVDEDVNNQSDEDHEESEAEVDNDEIDSNENEEEQTNVTDIIDIQSDESMEFVEAYNESATSNEVELIDTDHIVGALEYDDDEYLLPLKFTDDFFIYTIIGEDGSVSSYNIEISHSEDLDNAVYAFANLTESLGIELQEIGPKLEEASTKESVTHFGDDYIVFFNNLLITNIKEGNPESDVYMRIMFTENFLGED